VILGLGPVFTISGPNPASDIGWGALIEERDISIKGIFLYRNVTLLPRSFHQGGGAADRSAAGRPLAFPVRGEDVRPLANSAIDEIAAAMGWSRPYTLGVLGRWKMASVYCQAVLCHDPRITLDGAPAEPVGAEAKDLPAKQLARLRSRKAMTKAAKAAAPAAVKPPPGPNLPIETPPKTPEQLRSRVRAALLRRSA